MTEGSGRLLVLWTPKHPSVCAHVQRVMDGGGRLLVLEVGERRECRCTIWLVARYPCLPAPKKRLHTADCNV